MIKSKTLHIKFIFKIYFKFQRDFHFIEHHGIILKNCSQKYIFKTVSKTLLNREHKYFFKKCLHPLYILFLLSKFKSQDYMQLRVITLNNK